LPQENIKPRK